MSANGRYPRPQCPGRSSEFTCGMSGGNCGFVPDAHVASVSVYSFAPCLQGMVDGVLGAPALFRVAAVSRLAAATTRRLRALTDLLALGLRRKHAMAPTVQVPLYSGFGVIFPSCDVWLSSACADACTCDCFHSSGEWRLEYLVGVLRLVRPGHAVAVLHEPRAGQWRHHMRWIQFSVVFDASVLVWWRRRRWRWRISIARLDAFG
jgi:hypothetical protein